MKQLIIKISDGMSENTPLSTSDKIDVISISDGYMIIFDTKTFASFKSCIANVAKTIIELFNNNAPDVEFDMTISVSNIYANNSSVLRDFYETLNAFIKIAKKFSDYSKITFNSCVNDDGESIEEYLNMKLSNYNPMNAIRDVLTADTEDDDSDDDEDDYDDDDDNIDLLSAMYGNNYVKNSKKKSKKKSEKDYYGTSRVWKNADNLKRSIKRHGVIIAESKKDIKADEKIIKQFLKDFIPGNSDWKKDFRNELLDRWISMFTIEKKVLKKHQKKMRNRRRKRRAIDPNKAVEFTRNLFNTPLSLWDDPSK